MTSLKFKPGIRTEIDGWTIAGEKFGTSEQLAAIKTVIEREGPVVLEHKFLRGGRGPHIAAFDDEELLLEYLAEHAHAGDKVSVWRLWPFMRDTPPLACGKCPDEDGTVPERGAY
jgi:hypothetical protein